MERNFFPNKQKTRSVIIQNLKNAHVDCQFRST